MPRLHYRKARNNIYQTGIKFPDPRTKSGFRRDKSKPADKQDKLLVARGEHYYTWQFKNSPPVISKTRPKRSQLTRSEFLGWLYDFEDDTLANFSPETPDDLESGIQDLISELENQRDELQSRLDNMPEQLQEADSGQILQSRIESLETAIDELNGIEVSYDEPDDDELRAEVLEEMGAAEINDEDEDIEQQVEDLRQRKLEEWLSERIEEVQAISIEG